MTIRSVIGFAAARTGLRQSHWIIGLLDASSVREEMTPSLLAQLQQVDSRLLLVLIEEPKSEQGSVAVNPLPQGDANSDDLLGLPISRRVDGGRYAAIVEELESLCEMGEPAVLRIVRRSAVPDPQTGQDHSDQPPNLLRMSPPAVVHAIAETARINSRVVVVELADEPSDLRLQLGAEFDDRFFEVRGIEQNSALVWCAALSQGGCHPIVSISRSFLKRHFSQLSAELCARRISVSIIVRGGRLDRSDEAFPQALPLLCARLLPNTEVLIPTDGADLAAMVSGGQDSDGPRLIFLPDGEFESPDRSPLRIADPSGRAPIEIARAGRDATLLTLGSSLIPVLSAAEQLSTQGIDASVVNVRCLHPIDAASLAAILRPSSDLIIVEAGDESGILSTIINDLVSSTNLNALLRTVRFERPFDCSPEAIAARVRHLLNDRDSSKFHSEERAGSCGDLPLFGYARAALEYERSLVSARTLRPELQSWIDTYERVGSRNPYLWKWALQGADLTTLPSVAAEWREHLCDTKVLSIILCVLLDDVADQRGNWKLLQALLAIAETGTAGSLDDLTSPDQREYAITTRQLFACYRNRIQQYPYFEVYRDLLTYDEVQYLNTMRYSHLVNHRLDLLNVAEHDLYLPHNMHMMSFATLDLMCSPNFECQELGKLREVIWHAQCMGRIANLLSTWQREIGQGDFTGGVFARALLEDDLTVDQLSPANRAAIEAVIRDGGHEDFYLRKWHEHRRAFENTARRIKSMNLETLLENHERFFRMHLGSRGLI